MHKPPARKRIRLAPEAYAVPGSVWHATATVLGRRPVLRASAMAEAVIDALQFQCRKGQADLLLFCVMPDHVHAVVAIGTTDLIAIMRDVKSWTTRLWTQRTGEKHLWQTSFHDHGVRQSENMDELITYVVENPQHAGLVVDWQDYPWIGGSLLEPAPGT
jgi:REP element-mobilizing transposase RayT